MVKSGNTVIEYTYDHKGRKTQVSVNGVKQIESTYEDYAQEGTRGAKFTKQTHTLHEDSTAITSVYLKTGVLNSATQRMSCEETLTCGNDSLYGKKYNTEEQLTEVTYKHGTKGMAGINYTYDSYQRLTKAQTNYSDGKPLIENLTYTPYGEVASKTYTGALNQAYFYTYEDNSTRKLSEISFGDYKFKPLSDVYGRNTGKEIYNAETKVAGEYISYRKVGDHATNMPSTVWYASGRTVKDNVKYKYDKCGNIIEITENNRLSVRYEYDKLNRLIKEDNRQLGKVYEFVYDTNGNILNKYITENGETITGVYKYDGDQLLSYNEEACRYIIRGNTNLYRGKQVKWLYGKYITAYDGNTFKYDSRGRRIVKNLLRHIYDDAGNLICICLFNQISDNDGNLKTVKSLQFVYDNAGVVGVIYDGTQYFYRKNVLGDIIAILDQNGSIVVKYIYDAWGNHAVVDKDGKNIEDPEHIGNKNPFRYRGYYYDVETGFYYLQTRYYDPEVGRFISQDSVEYADPESINGLNLYAYCGNNPVKNIDPNGTSFAIQIVFSALMYLGFAISAIFDADIRNDMAQIGWNPFNSDESAVLNSSKVSFYKGVPVFRTDFDRSGSFYGIFLRRGYTNSNGFHKENDPNTVRHEWGHHVQLWSIGNPLNYLLMIALPSWKELSNRPYYQRPWEATADAFGGVSGRTKNPPTQADIDRGYWYLAVSALFGPFGLFFLLGEY